MKRATVGYPAGVDVGGVEPEDLTTFGVDTDGDGTVDRNLTSAVESVEMTDDSVTVTLSARQEIGSGEMLVVGFESIRNPSLGTYTTAIRFDDRPAERATLVVGDANTNVFEFESNNESHKLVRASPSGSANVSLGSVGSGGAELQRLSVAFGDERSSVIVGRGDDMPTPVGIRGQELGKLTLEHSDGNVASVTVEFTVDKSRLAETKYGPADVSLYYRANGDWRGENPKLVGETATAYQYRVEAATLSSYSIWAGPNQPDHRSEIRVREVTLNRTEVEPGTPVRVSVAARNVGNVSGQRVIAASVNGVIVGQSDVSLADGESTTVEFTHTFDRTGQYDLAVGDASVSVRVRPDGTASPSPRPTTPGFGPVVALFAGTVVALLGRYTAVREVIEDNS